MTCSSPLTTASHPSSSGWSWVTLHKLPPVLQQKLGPLLLAAFELGRCLSARCPATFLWGRFCLWTGWVFIHRAGPCQLYSGWAVPLCSVTPLRGRGTALAHSGVAEGWGKSLWEAESLGNREGWWTGTCWAEADVGRQRIFNSLSWNSSQVRAQKQTNKQKKNFGSLWYLNFITEFMLQLDCKDENKSTE